MRNLRKFVAVLAVLVLVSSQSFAVSLSEKETVKIENALEKSKASLIQQEIVIEQLSTELKKQSESYRKLERDKARGEIRAGLICFGIGTLAGVAYGVYVCPLLSN